MAATKEASRAIVQRLISLQLRDSTHRHLFTMHGIRGQIAHERLMRIARQSLVDTAFDTEAHRDILEYEAQIPTQVFFDRVNIAGWVSLKKDVFYETDSEWKARAVPTMPVAADITNEQVHELLGYSGGGGEGSDNPFPESHAISVADRRLQQVCEWAIAEYPKASLHTYGNIGATADDRYLRRAASVFKGLVYATLHLALNAANLTDARWALLEKNLVPWKTFVKLVSDTFITVLYLVDNRFYDGSIVWLWSETSESLFRARVSSGTEAVDTEATDLDANAIPELGLGKDHYTVREMLELRHHSGVHLATLSELGVVDQDENPLTLSPAFSSDVMEYVVEAAADAVLTPTATATYEYATVTTTISLNPTKILVAVESQDQENREVYTITVNRTGGV